ncbi:hypothetical protein CYMTET_50475, partial [Cymbomonas tetramitiformis]
CELAHNLASDNGGAIFADGSVQPRVVTSMDDLLFRSNAALEGGGGALFSLDSYQCNTCIFTNNSARYGNVTAGPTTHMHMANFSQFIRTASGAMLPEMHINAHDAFSNVVLTYRARAWLTSSSLSVTNEMTSFEAGAVLLHGIQVYGQPGSEHGLDLEVLPEAQAASAVVETLHFTVSLRNCTLDEYVDDSLVCQPCTEGMYPSDVSSTASNRTCISCDAGQLAVEHNGTLACRACPAGTFQTNTEEHGRVCEECSPGSYQTKEGQTNCFPCEKGEYSALSGRPVQCDWCARGYFQNVSGSTGCLPCPHGYFADEEREANCKRCEMDTFTSALGSAACTPCPNHTHFHLIGTADFLVTAAGTAEDCLPDIGYYGLPGVQAQVCPTGGVCCHCAAGSFTSLDQGLDRLEAFDALYYTDYCNCEMGTSPFPYPAAGYVRNEAAGYEDHFVMCSHKDSCRGALTVREGETAIVIHTATIDAAGSSAAALQLTAGYCSMRHTGRLCHRCASGYYELGGECTKCPASYTAKLLLNVGGGAALVALWTFVAVYLSVVFTSLDIFLLHIQMNSMVHSFKLGWPSSLDTWAQAMNVLDFDIDFMKPQCLFEHFSYRNMFHIQLTMPAVFCLIVSFLYIIRKYQIARSTELSILGKDCATLHVFRTRIAAVLLLQSIMYHQLCKTCFEPWMCFKMGDELYYMQASPDIECWNAAHYHFLALSVVGLVVYVFGIPAWHVGVLYFGTKHAVLGEASFTAKFGWMYEAYRLEWIWWSIMLLLRRFVFAAICVFCQREPVVQIVWSLICLHIFIVGHFFARPFVDPLVNVMDGLSLTGLYIIVIAGCVFYFQEDHAISIAKWTNYYYCASGFPMMFGILIFGRDLYEKKCRFRVKQKLYRSLPEDMAAYEHRFHTVVQHLHALSEDTAGGMTQEEFVAFVVPLDDGVLPELKEWHAARIFQRALQTFTAGETSNELACAADEASSASSPSNELHERPSRMFKTDSSLRMCYQGLEMNETEAGPRLSSAALQHGASVLYCEVLVRDAIVGIQSMQGQSGGARIEMQGLSREEMMEIWHFLMPDHLAYEFMELLLSYVYLPLANEARVKFQIKDLLYSLEKLSQAGLLTVWVGKGSRKFEEQSVLYTRLMNCCLATLLEQQDASLPECAELSDVNCDRSDSVCVNPRTSRSRSIIVQMHGSKFFAEQRTKFRGFTSELKTMIKVKSTKFRDFKSEFKTMMKFTSIDVMAAEKDACHKLLDLLKPHVLQAWLSSQTSSKWTPVFRELGKSIHARHHLSSREYCVQLHHDVSEPASEPSESAQSKLCRDI